MNAACQAVWNATWASPGSGGRRVTSACATGVVYRRLMPTVTVADGSWRLTALLGTCVRTVPQQVCGIMEPTFQYVDPRERGSVSCDTGSHRSCSTLAPATPQCIPARRTHEPPLPMTRVNSNRMHVSGQFHCHFRFGWQVDRHLCRHLYRTCWIRVTAPRQPCGRSPVSRP